MRKFIKRKYYQSKSLLRIYKVTYWLLVNQLYKHNLLSVYDIPVVINNFNRLTFPSKLIEFLERCGFTNIVILDNNSTYPPLLEFYRNCSHKVIRELKNHGHLAFWKCGLYRKYKWNYFVYSDPDVMPIDECPKDFIKYFKEILDENYKLDKIGFGIKIDDLPDSFCIKDRVIEYEKRYWEKEVKPNLYEAPIDTTFALYKPFSNLLRGEIYTLSAFRTNFPFLIRHLPWYVDSNKFSEEELFYMRTCNSSSTIGKQFNGVEKIY